jgi:molybdenum-dependent DNA-binding transcriptional regulator ModE
VVLQPAQRALLEGIRRSGRQSGAARVLEISYLGGGRFRATVGVR